MISEYSRKLQELKEMVQFGPGVTFADLMQQFRDIGDALADSLPWVPFSADGNIKCTIIPTYGNDGFELILVRVERSARFPDDESMGFSLASIAQHIKAIDGSILVQRKGFTQLVTQDNPITIPAGEKIAYTYSKGLFMFRQSPGIASAEDFVFGVI